MSLSVVHYASQSPEKLRQLIQRQDQYSAIVDQKPFSNGHSYR